MVKIWASIRMLVLLLCSFHLEWSLSPIKRPLYKNGGVFFLMELKRVKMCKTYFFIACLEIYLCTHYPTNKGEHFLNFLTELPLVRVYKSYFNCTPVEGKICVFTCQTEFGEGSRLSLFAGEVMTRYTYSNTLGFLLLQ